MLLASLQCTTIFSPAVQMPAGMQHLVFEDLDFVFELVDLGIQLPFHTDQLSLQRLDLLQGIVPLLAHLLYFLSKAQHD